MGILSGHSTIRGFANEPQEIKNIFSGEEGSSAFGGFCVSGGKDLPSIFSSTLVISPQLKRPFVRGEGIGFTEYFMLFKLIVTRMAFAKHLTQRDECKPLTVKPVLLTLELSNSVKRISLNVIRLKKQGDS